MKFNYTFIIIYLIPLIFIAFLKIDLYNKESTIGILNNDISTIQSDLNNIKESFSGSFYDTNKRIESLNIKSVSKLYDLDITACLLDTDNNVFQKRHIIMKSIIGINPRKISGYAIDTGVGQLNIDLKYKNGDEEYICDLKVLSVK